MLALDFVDAFIGWQIFDRIPVNRVVFTICNITKFDCDVTFISASAGVTRMTKVAIMLQNIVKCTLLFFVSASVASTPAHADLIKIETGTGLKAVYLLADEKSENIRVSAVILAGEADSNGPEGLAHYLEHLMFWHADGVHGSGKHNRGGNATAGGLITNYYNEGRRSELDDLFVFAQRLLTKPDLDREFMLAEKRIVAREYDLSVSEKPGRRAWFEMNRELYGPNPVGKSVYGTPQTIASMTLEQVEAFRSKHYVAENMVLLASGNLTETEVRHQVQKNFASLDKRDPNRQSWRHEPLTDGLSKRVEIADDRVKNDSYLYSSLSHWPGSGDPQQDYYTADFVKKLLRSSLPGSLEQPLRVDDFVVARYEVNLIRNLRNAVQFFFGARPDDGVDLAQVSQKLQESLVLLAQEGIPERSLERIRKRFAQEAERRNDDVDYALERAIAFLTAGLEPNDSADHLRRIARVSKADIDQLLTSVTNRQRTVEVNLVNKAL